MSYLIFKDVDVDRHPHVTCSNSDCDVNFGYEIGINGYGEEIQLQSLLDEMKFELFLENINNKSLEEIQNFFNKK